MLCGGSSDRGERFTQVPTYGLTRICTNINLLVFWSWIFFPLFRTLLLFISSLAIFVLRVAQLHFGARTTASAFETFRQYAFHINTVQTLAWYFFSAWWFSEVYIWSASASANLSWTKIGKYELVYRMWGESSKLIWRQIIRTTVVE